MMSRLRSELSYARGLLRVVKATKLAIKRDDFTLGDHLAEWAAQNGDRPALSSEREALTYAELDGRANAYARWAQARGLGKGDSVALMMPNRPEYAAIWFGLVRAGLGVALINTNLVGASLAHSFDVVNARAVIVDSALSGVFDTARGHGKSAPPAFFYGIGPEGAPRLDLEIAAFARTPLTAPERPALTLSDPALYIYTSGTTGMPKAARITHSRALRIMLGFAASVSASRRDRVYMCLPMYHSNGGVIALGMALAAGGSAFIREKFSASAFWADCVREKCTLFVYIGELCRYLMNAPERPEERAHKVRACLGNGLRPDIYEAFQKRFGIRAVYEFYGSTEGNAVMLNMDFKPGAVGRIPGWAAARFPVALAAYDVEADAHPRDGEGFARATQAGEIGELVAEIRNDPNLPAARFDGYADKAATDAKILRDLFRKGDKWFRSGDLMKRDARGYFYFIDRIGDTFRWKGENVATTEVAETISAFPGVQEAIVYGVAAPGYEGRAGMAAVVVENVARFDLAGLRAHLENALPSYARPLFLRFRHELDATGTFKPRKSALVAEGFDPAAIAEPLYFDDRRASAYRPLDATLHEAIVSGAQPL
jgi:fatty-acyl-CoA synthase